MEEEIINLNNNRPARYKMMKAKLLIILSILLFAGKLIIAQDMEVMTGPYLDSSSYVAPSPLKSVKGILPVTHYQQCLQSWSSDLMGSGTCTSTICQQGCAMTCAAMLLTANSVNVDPGQLNAWLQGNSGYTNCSIYWTVADDYPGSTMTWYGTASFSLSTVKSEIDAGNPVLAHVEYSSPCSHFVLIYGYYNLGLASGDFVIADPATLTFPTYLSDYNVCSASDDATPLRIFHGVTVPCTIPSTPTCIAPGTGSAPGEGIGTLNPTLSWAPVSSATDYDVFIRRDPPSGPLVLQVHCITDNSYTVPDDTLVNNAYYCWNTQANVNCNQCESAYAAPLYFNTIIAGVNAYEGETDFKIFPNPNAGVFNISINSAINETVKIDILNLIGEKILTREQSLISGENKTDVNLADAEKGIYFVKLQTKNVVLSRKLIIE
jgi:hypothetical protein